ncbi:MAG: glycosyltransferase family 4 protein, partial [Planctomycetes bacterium]|nr:glycosyltransferase family 4 protein [Planctomycetota bacterium]
MGSTIDAELLLDRLRGFEPPTSFRRQWRQMLFYPTLMQGFVARRMARIVTVSEASAQVIRRDFRVAAHRIRVVYNGLDSDRFHPGKPDARVPGRVIYVGNLEDRNKGVPFLLQALPLCKRLRELVVISASPDKSVWARDMVRDIGCGDKVRFRFQVSREVWQRWYASAEVAVSPSIFEGFGFPAAEAMACGLPVVAARGGALPEVVGDTGILVPPRDSRALAQALDRLLGDAALRARLGQAARNRVRSLVRSGQAAC